MTSTPLDPPGPEGAGPDPERSLPSELAAAPEPTSPAPITPAARPGLTFFTIEGRAAPGLFVVGWLATLAGLGLVLIGVLASSPWFLYLIGPAVLTVGLVAGAGNQSMERRARGAAYAGPSPYLVFAISIAATFAAVAATGLILERIPGMTGMPQYVAAFLTVLIQGAVFLGVIRLTVVGTDALSWTEMGWRRFDRAAATNLLRGAAFALPVIGVTSILAGILVNLLGQVPESPLPPTGTNEGLVLNLIAGAVIAPVVEEAMFRGFAVSAWQRTVGETGAIVRASLVFALAHVINAGGTTFAQVGALIAIGFLTRIPVAFVLGWLFVRARSIWAPIGLHVTFNAILLVVAELAIRSGTS